MRLSLLMLAALVPALPAFAAETPELQRAVGVPQAVGAVHTLRQIPEACARLEGVFTGDAAAPYRFSAVRTSEQCQPRALRRLHQGTAECRQGLEAQRCDPRAERGVPGPTGSGAGVAPAVEQQGRAGRPASRASIWKRRRSRRLPARFRR